MKNRNFDNLTWKEIRNSLAITTGVVLLSALSGCACTSTVVNPTEETLTEETLTAEETTAHVPNTTKEEKTPAVITSTIETEIVTDANGETQVESKVVWEQNGTTSYVEPTTSKSDKVTEATTEKSGEGSVEPTSKAPSSNNNESKPASTTASTEAPTQKPTEKPTQAPTAAPTVAPTQAPTVPPTTAAPTEAPTPAPTTTQAPTEAPTFAAGHEGYYDEATKTLVVGSAYQDISSSSVFWDEHEEFHADLCYYGNGRKPLVQTVRFEGASVYGTYPLGHEGIGLDYTNLTIYATNCSYHDAICWDHDNQEYYKIEDSFRSFQCLNGYPGGIENSHVTVYFSDLTIEWIYDGVEGGCYVNGVMVFQGYGTLYPVWDNQDAWRQWFINW